jgi:hypothetical protein
MNNPEKICAFLKSNKEMRFCDACITRKIGTQEIATGSAVNLCTRNGRWLHSGTRHL